MDNQNLGGEIPPEMQPPVKPPLNKGVIIVLSAGIIILLVAVIYLLTTKKAVSPEVADNNPVDQNQQTKNQDETVDWKTYAYGKIGYEFEFKYPADWEAPQSSPYGVVVLGCPEVNLEGDLQCPIFIEVRPPLSKSEYIKTMTPMKFEYQNKLVSNMDFVETQINGFNSISYLDAGLDILAKAVIFGENSIIIFNDSGANYYQSGIFNQIISTFKFTNQNETADWKTYKNEKYGFELKYPNEYRISTSIQTNVGPAIETDFGWIEFRNINDSNSKDLFKKEGTKIFINGYEALEMPVTGNRDNGIDYDVLIKYSNSDDYLGISFTTKKAGYDNKLAEFKEILSTFKFIN